MDLRVLLLLLLLPCPALAQDLSIDLLPGLVQNRNFEQSGRWQRQWVRSVPPGEAPFLMVVRGPRRWLAQAGRAQPVAELSAANSAHLRVLTQAMRAQGWLERGDPVLTGARLVSLLRPVPTQGQRAPARYPRLWQLWEVLADALHADTLSSAFAAVQGLHGLDIPARLARYPSVNGEAVFGVWLPGQPNRNDVPWARAVNGGSLLSMAPSAQPAAGLQGALTLWTWDEVLAEGWDPGGALSATTATIPPGAVPSGGHGPAEFPAPDICTQARALGLDCVPPNGSDGGLYWISAGLLGALGVLGWGGWRARQRRLARHRVHQERRAERNF